MTDEDDDVWVPDEEDLVRHTAKRRSLTRAENEQVDRALAVSQTDLVAEKDGIRINGFSIHRLGPGAGSSVWLNDEIVNYYFGMIGERPGIYCFNTFFYSKLTERGLTKGFFYDEVQRWTKRLPNRGLFEYNQVYFPLHISMCHWALIRVLILRQRIEYYDSMGSSNGYLCLKNIRTYLKYEMAKYNLDYQHDEWTLWRMNTPQQGNAHDCGVFTCKLGDYLSDGVPLLFSQEDMPYFRRRMVLEIVNGKLE